MDRFQNTYRIPSARANWHGYDGGVYFVTICTKNRDHYLGEITCCHCTDVGRRVSMEPQMQLSPIGQYAHEQFVNVKTHYPYAEIPLFVVMPNHIHAIVVIDGVDNCDFRDGVRGRDAIRDAIRDAMNRVSTGTGGGITGNNNPMLQKCLGTVIRGLKARITHYANEKNIIFAWQTRFYDRIVRDQNELNRIAEYIENNVVNWQTDELNKYISDTSCHGAERIVASQQLNK